MSNKEMNENKPLMRCRKWQDDVKIESPVEIREKFESNLITDQTASGIEMA